MSTNEKGQNRTNVGSAGINPFRAQEEMSKRGQSSHYNALSITLFLLLLTAAVASAIIMDERGYPDRTIFAVFIPLLLLALLSLTAIQVAKQWEKAVVLRLGRFHGLKGPGMFLIIPILDSITSWIDQRVMVTPFNAEKTLTRDTVPVNVDAVLFWMVWDAEKAALEVEDYRTAIAWASQTALREVIGQMTLADILVGRDKMDADLQKIIDERTTPWGITVQSVEIRDVIIPQTWKTPCRARRRPNANARRASSWANPKNRLPPASPMHRSLISTTPPRCTCAP